MFTNLLAGSGAVTSTSTYERLQDILGHKEHWKACPEARRRELATEWIDLRKQQADDGGRKSGSDRADLDDERVPGDSRSTGRRRDDVPDRSPDRYADDDRRRRKRHRGDADRGDPDRGERADRGEHRYRQRFIEKQFMYLLMDSDVVTSRSTYEDLEYALGMKEQWQSCPPASRRELVKEYIDVKKRLG
mmetsp:Transcript_95690/g.180145  ORF Transcript_95690/g.180145 Transcript_95690/m.180145 type:complete len:190 (+) Transcript_95690:1-570(+)